MQLAVLTAEGTVFRFGPVVSGGPESGFHSPRIADPAEAGRFAEAAFRPGSLVSNGFRSFRNGAGEARNRAGARHSWRASGGVGAVDEASGGPLKGPNGRQGGAAR